ncbi:MAG: methyltransferase [Deltaproteobacteria bacterium]|nr:methyltransferase [Deltaproteobacteria bacterium]
MEALAITEKYELDVKPISIQGKTLELYGLSNWDSFVANLEEKGESYIQAFPFWIKIWEASIILADHMLTLDLDKEKHVLEIGAGMGLTGLFLGAFGHQVTITDCEEEALQLLRLNVAHNNLSHVQVKKLDWNEPDLVGRYDIICGSELVYKETFIEPLIELFRKYLKPAGTVFIAHDIRRMCMMKFIATVPGRFEIENVGKTLRGEDDIFRILVHTLHLKESTQPSKEK